MFFVEKISRDKSKILFSFLNYEILITERREKFNKQMIFFYFFRLLWVIFGLLDPDSESGSTDPIESGSNRDPDPQPCFGSTCPPTSSIYVSDVYILFAGTIPPLPLQLNFVLILNSLRKDAKSSTNKRYLYKHILYMNEFVVCFLMSAKSPLLYLISKCVLGFLFSLSLKVNIIVP